ncbi:hypothetical protein [Gilliamella sp. ESL0250]|uniref:hypothetical protein n=1 Tax=Gilliamella sp. ESL0250 TaxID=2705036 RepID=UPI001581283D|nr:hypothetical protein [Gilliamella sp. ESL0250]NUF50080.1 hypothetical protein [Gilliamella sp. ESL0250]
MIWVSIIKKNNRYRLTKHFVVSRPTIYNLSCAKESQIEVIRPRTRKKERYKTIFYGIVKTG